MKPPWKLLCALGVGVAATAAFAAPAAASPAAATAQHAAGRPDAPIFVQSDNLNGNAIIAYARTASGELHQLASYPTGGRGGALSGSVVDHLASQGSLSYDPGTRLLYAVNAGSNTITTFAVHGDRLTRRQIIGSGGAFPVSIATRGAHLYVLNARDGGSVSGYRVIAGGRLVAVPGWHRALHLNTSAPGQADEFTSTPGQIGVTPDGRTLLVSTKNGGNTVAAFRLGTAGPARQPTITSLPGAVPFGFTFDQAGHLALTEAGPNTVATFTIDRAGRLRQLDAAPTGQAATCWVVAARGNLYASNAGSANLSRYAATRAGTLTARGTTPTHAGTVDAAASTDGRYLYVQTGAAGVVDAYRIGAGGALTETGSVTVPGAVGGEGIVAL